MYVGRRLGDCAALVTGGGGEIGGAICRRFASEGAWVVAADISLEKAKTVAKEISETGGQSAAIEIDVSDEKSAERGVEEALRRLGRLTCLVNVAAAVTPDGTAETLPLSEWENALRVNLTGPFLMCKYAAAPIRQAGGGSVINIASELGHLHVAGRAPYCTSKAALISLTRVLAMDFARDHIRVNSISPGFILTDRSSRRSGGKENARRVQGRKNLLNRPGDVNDIAAGAAYLVSEDAAFITGTDLLIDGGYVTFKGVIGPNGEPTM